VIPCTATEVPQVSLNATEDLSMSTEDPPSLNRSYDMSRAGRRTRSAAAAARSSARRSRIRQASSTSSVPATATATADGGDQMVSVDDGRGQANVVGDTSGLLLCRLTHMLYRENDKTLVILSFKV